MTSEDEPAPTDPLAGKRIVFVTPRYPPYVGGTEVHTAEVASRLAAEGVDVRVLTADTSARRSRRMERDGVIVQVIPARPKRSDLYAAPSIGRALSALEPDLVHVQGYHTLFGPAALWASRRLGVPHVLTFHSGGHSSHVRNVLRPVHQRVLRSAFRQADALVAVSEFERQLFARRTGLQPHRIALIPSGTTMRVIDRATSPTGRTVITSMGRLERYKGHQQMIKALPHLLTRRPDVELRLIGSGTYETRLRSLVAKYDVVDHVRFLSVPSNARDELAELLAESDLITLLSEYESQGLAAYEALSLRVPLLVLETTALAELATAGLAAAVPPRSTPALLASLIDRQLDQPLRPKAAHLPGWDRTVTDLRALYGRVLLARERATTAEGDAGRATL